MKHILVPTDFSIQSLRPVHEIVRRNPQQSLHIHLVHLLHVPTDITDLLFQKRHHMYKKVPDHFMQAMEMLKNKYQHQIKWMAIEFYYGHRLSILNDIISNLKIEEVYLLDHHSYPPPFEQSADLISLINRCKLPLIRLPQKVKQGVPGDGNLLSSLFTDEYQVTATAKLVQPA